MWLYGQGFPKSHDLGKAMGDDTWSGYGIALKPAYEPIIAAMKPLDGSFVRNAREWGVAGLNIDGCRIGDDEITVNRWQDGCKPFGGGAGHAYTSVRFQGRYPANVILDEEGRPLARWPRPRQPRRPVPQDRQTRLPPQRRTALRRRNRWRPENAPDGDASGISRFFYCAKASSSERNAGLDGFPIERPDKRSGKGLGIWDEKGIQPQQNHHPCVKPIACPMACPVNSASHPAGPRKILVPYCGSGSEMIGAMLAGWDEVLGIERDENYVAIAKARLQWWRENAADIDLSPHVEIAKCGHRGQRNRPTGDNPNDDWRTPAWLFDLLDGEFHFGLDAAASADNTKCGRFFDAEQDGLARDWGQEIVWCNRPYDKTVGLWVEKGWVASQKGATVVMLLPDRTHADWYHKYVLPHAEVRFIEGWVPFRGKKRSNTQNCLLAIFRPAQRATLVRRSESL